MEKTVVARLRMEIGEYLAALGKAGVATGQFVRNVSGAGDAASQHVRNVGRGALVMAGGLTIALGSAVKAAMDWESAWAGVTKTVGAAAGETAEQTHAAMGQLEDDLRGLATRLPATHKEIAAVAEAAGQLGIQRSAIASFTETMIALGVSTNLTADQAATGIAQIANVMGTSQSDLDRFGAALVALGNVGASTEKDILEMATRLAGAGKLVGASEADVLGLANAMSSMGIEAQLGGGAFSRVMLKIYDAVKTGGAKLQAFAEVAGTTASQFATAFEDDPIQAIGEVIRGLNELDQSGGNVIGKLKELGFRGTQDLQVLLKLKGGYDVLTDSLKLGSKAWIDNVALQQEAEKRYETTASQLRILGNQVTDVGIDMGNVFLPAIKSVVGGLGTMVTGFGEMGGAGRTAVVALATVATGVTGVVGLLGVVGPKVEEFRKGLMGMGDAGKFVGRNLGTIAAGVGVVVTALGIYTAMLGEKARKEQEERAAAKGFADAITEAGDAATGAANHVRDLVQESPELTRMLQATGSSLDEMTSALLHGGSEWTAFKGKILDAASGSGLSLELLEGALDGVALASRTGVDDAAKLAEIEAQSQGPAERLAHAKKELADNTQAVADAVKAEIDAQMALFDPIFGMTSALIANKEAQANLQGVLADGTSTAEDIQKAYLEVAKTALEADGAALQLAAGVQAGTIDIDLAKAGLQGLVDAGLIPAGEAMVILGQLIDANVAKADELAGDRVGSIIINTNADQVIEKLGQINARFASMPRYVPVDFVGPLVQGQQRGTPASAAPSAPPARPVGSLGARAGGGPVRAGGSYWVGEQGRELVTFDHDGYVHDAASSASMASRSPVSRFGAGPGATMAQPVSRFGSSAAGPAGMVASPPFVVHNHNVVELTGGGALGRSVDSAILRMVREAVRRGGGDVQRVLGQGRS